MIVIVDYDMGNIRSVHKALEHVGGTAVVTRNPNLISKASQLVVPGVGAFADCMKHLAKYDLIKPIGDFIASGRPYLGICLGMQILMTESEEDGPFEGLNIFEGRVVRFPQKDGMKVPHMGWNSLQTKKESVLLKGIPEESYVYFVHSYYVAPKDSNIIASTTNYSATFTSCIESKNVFATQFHPEKSQKIGLQILKNFVGLT